MKCKNCKWHDDCVNEGGLSWPCRSYRPKILTAADCIRMMNDEDLLEFFCSLSRRVGCPPSSDNECVDNCEKCWRDYLHRPVKEG